MVSKANQGNWGFHPLRPPINMNGSISLDILPRSARSFKGGRLLRATGASP